MAGPKQDKGFDFLGSQRVGHTDGGGQRHRRVIHQRRLDLDRRDVLAPGDDDVLAAVAQLDVHVRVQNADVARVKPAAAETAAKPAPSGSGQPIKLTPVRSALSSPGSQAAAALSPQGILSPGTPPPLPPTPTTVTANASSDDVNVVTLRFDWDEPVGAAGGGFLEAFDHCRGGLGVALVEAAQVFDLVYFFTFVFSFNIRFIFW